ncbi:kinase-like domain-containing protein [Mycena sp. CBHHK59/15]|nr:kinase-like domain-containing protein [Mycena sp. CBHHK59/15]
MSSRFYPQTLLPRHLEYWERLDLDDRTAHLVDEPWRHFEPFLASRGYTLCWRYYSRERPETPIRPTALTYPVAQNPFRPRNGENFVSMYDIDDNLNQISDTTGWMTQCPSLKMGYDAQDRIVALKALHNSRARAEIDLITFLNAPTMRACPDNHTIPLLDKIVTEEWTFIVMPYWPRSVQACIPWEVEDYFNRLAQALEGLCFMHRHGIIHRDISVGNMLLNVHYGVPGVYSSFTRRNIALAYIDFGCACRFNPDSDRATWVGTGYVGTMEHAAPEIPRGDNRHSQQPYRLLAVDVYALGSVFTRGFSWEKIYCKTFGNPEGLPTAAHQVIEELVPEYLSLLDRMKDPDPTRRPSARMALQECLALRDSIPHSIRFAPPSGYPDLSYLRLRRSF